MVLDQLAGEVEGRPLPVDQGGRLGEPLHQPVPLGVGPRGESAEVDLDRLGRRQQRGERVRPERGVGRPGLGGPLHVGDQPRVRGERRLARVRVGVGRYAGRQPADGAEQRVRDRGGHRGRACRPPRRSRRARRPGARRGPRAGPPRARSPCRSRPGRARRGGTSGCAGAAQGRRRRPAAAPRTRAGAPRRAGRPAPGGRASRREPGEPGGHPVGRQVLRHPVVLMPSAVLARLRDVEIADRPHPCLQLIHATDVTRAPADHDVDSRASAAKAEPLRAKGRPRRLALRSAAVFGRVTRERRRTPAVPEARRKTQPGGERESTARGKH